MRGVSALQIAALRAPDAQPAQVPPNNAQAPENATSSPRSPDLADKSNPLDDLIATIRAAIVPDASAEARATGATACRAILAALEAQVGQPLAAAPSPTPTSPLAGMLSRLAAMPREQMLEFITNFLRAKLPPGTQAPITQGPRFHLIQLPQVPPPQRR